MIEWVESNGGGSVNEQADKTTGNADQYQAHAPASAEESAQESPEKVTGAKPGLSDSGAGEMTLLETTQSVLWAILGVQSKRNASRDFKKGKFSHFLIIGLAFAALFVFTLVGLISVILGQVAP